MLKINRQFTDERWSKYRCVTCLDWSEIHPELLAASYFYNEVQNDPDGIVLIWNLKYKKDTPEFVFNGPVSVSLHFSVTKLTEFVAELGYIDLFR
jgi:dynein intermediate chain